MLSIAQQKIYSPKSLSDALKVLSVEPVRRAFAGGTDLMVERHFKEPDVAAKYLNLQTISELQNIEEKTDGVMIGAGVSFAHIRSSKIIHDRFSLLWLAAGEIGTQAIQNRATIGGNIANASPAGDSLPALLAYDAHINLASSQKERTVAYADFHTGYKKSIRKHDELITSVFLPFYDGGKLYYRKVGTRKAQAISKIAFAALAQVNFGKIENLRIAFASMAPIPLRAIQAEKLAQGRKIDNSLIAQIVDLVQADFGAIDDIRSTKDYRETVALRLLREFLQNLPK